MSPEELAAGLRRLAVEQANDDLADAKGELGALFRREQKANFGRAEDSSGASWPPRKGNPSNPPLFLTGKMYAAATTLGAPGNVTKVEDRAIEMRISSVEVPYAARHNKGLGNMPRREFFYWRKDKLVRAVSILKKPLRRIFTKVFGT